MSPPTASNSHVDANVPAASDFEALLARDLATYFARKSGQNVFVQSQALRMGQTQSGVAYPKFYFWVTIRERVSHNKIMEGAVRVAAVRGTSFDITDFISIDEIKKQPDALEKIFPAAVIERINDHIR